MAIDPQNPCESVDLPKQAKGEIQVLDSQHAKDFLKEAAEDRHYGLFAVALTTGIRLYDLRHTAATLALGTGVPAKVVSEQPGHASVASLWIPILMCFHTWRSRQPPKWKRSYLNVRRRSAQAARSDEPQWTK
jgi:integrase